jgi:SAM-dependent methyltransferase
MTRTPEYDEQVAAEKREFDPKKYDASTLLENTSNALNYTLERFNGKVAQVIGASPWDYVVQQVNARPGAKILSLGSGPCGLELALARQFTVPFELTCLDLNEQLLELGAEAARREGIAIRTLAQDANFLALDETYDVVVAHAALHHFLNFEHIFEHLHRHMSRRAIFIAYEPVPRNGMLLWPETKEVLNRVFASLPPRYRRAEGQLFDTYPDVEYTQGTFECVRSEEVAPLLERYFHVEAKVPGYAFVRRFVDGGFGANYDLTREEDCALLEMLLAFDDALVAQGHLKPEHVFMVMRRRG